MTWNAEAVDRPALEAIARMTARWFICASCRRQRPIDQLHSKPGSFDPKCKSCVKPKGRFINGIRIWDGSEVNS